MKRIVLALLALSLPAALCALPAESIEKDVRTLAADDMEGRGLGTKGIEKAASYLEGRMKAIGLEPVFGTSYRQPFPVKTGVSAGTNNKLGDVPPADWTPLGCSSAGAFEGQIAFVGYGISAPPLNYDDYAGIDLKGKVALMLRYEPQEKDEKSPFDGRKPSRWSALRYKVLQARERGAVAVIFATGPLQDEGQNKIPALTNDGPESPAGIPVLQVRTSVAEKWVGDLAKWQKDVDSDLKPRSRLLDAKIAGNADVKAEYAETANLAGMIRGNGANANDIIVVGAHYDHLGYGGEGSMKPNVHAVHHGADDNASGTAAVLAIAERMKKMPAEGRTVVFMLFSGEERGLAGSGYFVSHAPFQMERVKAMVNLDMVGALRDGKVTVFGTDSAKEWRPLVDKANARTKLTLTETGDGYGPSDQTSFYAVHIPVLHLFTGAHDRYHTPEDVADAVNFPGIAQVVDLTTNIAASLRSVPTVPQYARATSAPAMDGDSRGYGAYLGTVPDYSAMDATTGGVLLSDVRPGSPADHAGIIGGDRIVDIGGTRIENLYDMTYALQDHKPGDTVTVKVVRKGEPVELRATLTQRGQQVAAVAAAHGSEGMTIGAGLPFTRTFDGEKHFKDIRQLTNGGENAEAYFSPDGKKLIFQSTPRGAQCDQEFTLNLVTGELKRVSSGKGRTTCGYYEYPKGDKIIYATTEGEVSGDGKCPPPADQSKGYTWSIYPGYDIVEANPDGSNAHPLIVDPGYDAEMTWCHQGGKAIFTSVRDGDLDLYEYTVADGKVKRLTDTPGYDGGAFYNAQCTEIVWRASRPTGEALTEYQWLLHMFLVRPTVMELWVMNADGTNQHQITHNGAANFCPYFTPDGKKIIYSSNAGDPKGREFDLYLISKNGGEPERITTAPGFDGFPMFSPDGQYIVWASNRADPPSHETNLFIAKWVD
ncbi:MAG TPA: M20/M25/M40 family metallo-hydrolase [Thermoanaerobaculia bacterium]